MAAPTTDAPAAIALPAAAPVEEQPAAIALADAAPTGAAPAAVALTPAALIEDAPVGIAGAAAAPDATPPAGIAVSGNAPVEEPPEDIATAIAPPTAAAPTGHALPDTTPAAGAPAAVALSAAAPTALAPARAPVGVFRPTAEPPRARGYTVTTSDPTDLNVNTPILRIEGALALNAIRGQTRLPAASILTRVQVEIQEPPVGAGAEITLVDADGDPVGVPPVTVAIADGETFGETVLATPVSLLAGANLRAKVTGIGSEQPGGFATLTLFTQLGA
ncbi:hypothetical protein K0B96_06650 [Horticoccus luteus]|uniref:Uncharacterized protein n=1 Tax=Horticoccus luteus TaxID=2862869 RepID=A0A8F9XMQ4_9BACT|nr:hypothetical protein [Horticoccus luteus]QYM80289.1 hypothetical protein K0B96_06650 [Horticoccus luteus]